MLNKTTMSLILEYFIVPAAQISILLYAIYGIYLLYKYKTFYLSGEMSKRESRVMNAALAGFLIFGILGVIVALLSQ